MPYIVTIKVPRNSEHDPHNKQTGRCPLSPECTDVTGEHHSALMTGTTLAGLRATGVHITRVERVDLMPESSTTDWR
jgi:hypothetical protein